MKHTEGILSASLAHGGLRGPIMGGAHPLSVPGTRPGSVLYVPPGYDPKRPAPLLLLLHGAGGTGESMVAPFKKQADRSGTVLVAPSSHSHTWDVIREGYGDDIRSIDAILEQLFRTLAVAPERIAIGGFSDGASYALSVGMTNGGLFSHVLAFSPGFMAPTRSEGSPRVFITHGTADRVLPIERCSRKMARRLEQGGFDLVYYEFEGGHVIPEEMVELAFRWFLEDDI